MLVKRGNDDELTVLIDKMVDDLSSTSSRAIPSIHRVGDNLRSINEKAYDPMAVAIGPIHRDKPHLKSMDHQKKKYNEDDERKLTNKDKDEDIIFRFDNIKNYVLNDLVLFENQIPFFVLEKLLQLSKTRDKNEAANLFWPLVSTSAQKSLQDCSITNSNNPPPHLLGFVHYVESLQFSPNLYAYNKMNINSATELNEAKLNCVRAMSPSNQRKFTDYMYFMHCLIHEPRDAKLLRRCGVISTWVKGDEMVYHLIKQMGNNVQPSVMFSYGDVFEGVNRHCINRKNTWMAVLRQDYFDSPWKVISLVAGFVLLGVGIVQMVFAILSYY
ncbi:PREDICTED: uncharacterized protein LOC105954315 [Erythranthe guttata]|uniref:uncharacterized protein LOC105954315 n=1 Tax=Erythranthe guttata TaxID=4155 RepID=UPI00064D7D78|nr:PREDICTED: uncharacterized protein LOC105954315 [Erythranthe guttata]|eukprot:XP_012833443.1 PREDICTED: uncharacterized protein LOC105954315 [Erythranthe guttata]